LRVTRQSRQEHDDRCGLIDKERIMKLKTFIAGIAVAGFIASFAAPSMAAGSGSGSGTTVTKPKPKKKKTSDVPALQSTIVKMA
jgi:hypothetical protein